jgi:nitronate monooxygenase
MLEAERAGAKALVVYMDDYPRRSQAWTTLRQVQADEAHNCALIGKVLENAGVPQSHATGEFFAKAIAIQGARERLVFLVRGLRWAVRQFEEAMSRTRDAEALDVMQRIRDTHLRSIAACEALAESPPS